MSFIEIYIYVGVLVSVCSWHVLIHTDVIINYLTTKLDYIKQLDKDADPKVVDSATHTLSEIYNRLHDIKISVHNSYVMCFIVMNLTLFMIWPVIVLLVVAFMYVIQNEISKLEANK